MEKFEVSKKVRLAHINNFIIKIDTSFIVENNNLITAIAYD